MSWVGLFFFFWLSYDPEAAVWQLISLLSLSDVLSARFLTLDYPTRSLEVLFTPFSLFLLPCFCLMKVLTREKVTLLQYIVSARSGVPTIF